MDEEEQREEAVAGNPEERTEQSVRPAMPFPDVPQTRWKKWGWDIVKVVLACSLLILGAIIWYQPPMVTVKSPYVTYIFQGKTFTDATLYRPLAIPTRFYIKLPHELARRYAWFAVDRRREIAAWAQPPTRRFFNAYAIRRSDPLGMDLEFTKIDGLEWNVGFYPESIVFSNAVLTVRIDVEQPETNP